MVIFGFVLAKIYRYVYVCKFMMEFFRHLSKFYCNAPGVDQKNILQDIDFAWCFYGGGLTLAGWKV